MEQIKVVKLKDGCDVVCDMSLVKGEYLLKNPMAVEMRPGKNGYQILMENWLPVGLIKDNEAFISVDEVICTLEPNEELIEYYSMAVERVNEALMNSEKGSEDDDMEEILEAFKEMGSKEHVFH